MLFKLLLFIILGVIMVKILILISKNRGLFDCWCENDYNTNKMYGISEKERKILITLKRLAILFFGVFFLFFLVFASDNAKTKKNKTPVTLTFNQMNHSE